MCESCIELPRERTPDEERAHQAVKKRLRTMFEADLKRRGVTMEELLDFDCPGKSRNFLPRPSSRFWSNLRLNFQLVTGLAW